MSVRRASLPFLAVLMVSAVCGAGLAVAATQAVDDAPSVAAADAALARGLEAYDAGDWPAAAAHFEAAREAGHPAAAQLRFALGHCAYRNGSLAEALHAYHLAAALGADASAVAEAIALAEARAGLAPGASAPPPRPSRTRWTAAFALGWLAECAGLLLALQAIARRSRSTRRQPARWLLAGLLLAVSGGVAGAIAVPRLAGSGSAALVLEAGQGLRAEPHAAAAVGAPLAAGEGIEVLAASDRWAQVRARGGVGWLPAAALGRVSVESLR